MTATSVLAVMLGLGLLLASASAAGTWLAARGRRADVLWRGRFYAQARNAPPVEVSPTVADAFESRATIRQHDPLLARHLDAVMPLDPSRRAPPGGARPRAHQSDSPMSLSPVQPHLRRCRESVTGMNEPLIKPTGSESADAGRKNLRWVLVGELLRCLRERLSDPRKNVPVGES